MIVFICLGIAGLAMFLFNALFGGHDHSDMGHEIGGPDGAHDTGPGFFSMFSLAFFLTGFGGVGTLLMAWGWVALTSTLVALGAGSCLWALAFAFMTVLHRQQADSAITTHKLVGAVGVVTVPISSESHLGKVQCSNCSEELIVRCEEPVATGALVRIVERAGGVYLVTKC